MNFFIERLKKSPVFYSFIFTLAFLCVPAFATKITIDADGGADYSSLNAALEKFVTAPVIDPDTILFTGNDQDTYEMSLWVNSENGNIIMKGASTNPDSFTIINRPATPITTYWSWFDKTSITFENLIFTGPNNFFAQTTKPITFKNCVIRGFTSCFFRLEGNTNNTITFENCLFENNTADSLLTFNFWSGTPKISITNCTFDNNDTILKLNSTNISNLSIKNCIFSNNTSITGANTTVALMNKFTYSLAPNITNFGTGSIASTELRYANPILISRTLPSHWKLQSTSPAKGTGTKIETPTNDISGVARNTSAYNMGVWDHFVHRAPTMLTLSNTTIAENNAVNAIIGIFRTTDDLGNTFSHTLVPGIGSADNDSFSITDSTLRTKISFNFEKKSSYSIRVKTTDQDADSLVKIFTITNTNVNEKPTSLILSRSHISDTIQGAAIVDTLKVIDPDNDSNFTYSIMHGADSTYFGIISGILYIDKNLSYLVKPSYSVNVRVKDFGGLFLDTTFTISVHPRPHILTEPLNDTAAQGTNVVFSVAASGTAPVTYNWYKTGSPVSLGITDTLKLSTVDSSHSGSYYCIINDAYGADTSVSATLTVTIPLNPIAITVQPVSDTVAVNKLKTAKFFVSATGTSLQYKWIKNGIDTIPLSNSDTLILDSIIAADSGSYTCLVYNTSESVLSNPAILKTFTTASITTISDTVNVAAGESTSIQVVAQGTNVIKYVWYKNGVVDSVGNQDTLHLINIPLSDSSNFYLCIVSNTLKTETFRDTSDTVFMKISPSLTGQIPLVTVQPKNDTVFTGGTFQPFITVTGTTPLTYSWYKSGVIQKVGTDSDTLTLNALSLTDSGTYYCIVTNITGSDTSAICTLKVIPSLCDFTAAPVAGVIPLPVTFNGSSTKTITSWDWDFGDSTTGIGQTVQHIYSKSGKYTVKLVTTSSTGKDSITKANFIDASSTPPINDSITLRAEAVSASKIKLSWTKIADIERIRIWKGTTELPLGNIISASFFDSLRVPVSDTTCIITNLLSSTNYYFGIQIYKNAAWSDISALSSNTATTLDPNSSSVLNTITIKNLYFDTLSASIIVSWCLDTTVAESLSIGLSYSTIEYPALSPEQILTVTKACDTTVLKVDHIQFNTKYYVALSLKEENGLWAAATEKSRDTISTGDFCREIVKFFNPKVVKDTVRAFNNTVVLWKDSTYVTSETTIDTIVSEGQKKYIRMVALNAGFSFAKQDPTAPFYIGQVYNVIPTGFTPNDIKFYRDSAGILLVEHNTLIDIAKKTVYVKTQNLEHPFILMIDTAAPKVTFGKDTGSIAVPSKDISDTVRIIDNIANVKYKYVYGMGHDAPEHIGASGLLDGMDKKINLLIPSSKSVISVNSGVRALLIVSDGTNIDTFNLSRRVMREQSDAIVTNNEQWFPVSVTAILSNNKIQPLFKKIKADTSIYDNRHMRFYRWIKTPLNTVDNRWVEYSPADSSLFTFVPGRLIWLKTRASATFNFGEGVTLSLKSNQEIELPPKEFTDCDLPYQFNMRLADILKSTQNGDSLQVYMWVKDTISTGTGFGSYSTKPIFLPGSTQKEDRNIVLDKKAGTGYSIYNPTTKAIILKIPPIPLAMSKVQPVAKQKGASSWSVKLTGQLGSGQSLPEIYCGYSPGNNQPYYPASPAFGTSRAMIYNRVEDRNYGHFISNEFKNGIAQEVSFVNKSSQSEAMKFNLEELATLPAGISAGILNTTSGVWEQSGVVNVDANSTELRWIIISDDNFRESFISKALSMQYGLCPAFPNPFRNIATIRFTVPFNANEKLRFSIFDALGRIVWQKQYQKPLLAGVHTLTWNGNNINSKQVRSGMYFIKLAVIDSKSKVSKTFESKLMYLH